MQSSLSQLPLKARHLARTATTRPHIMCRRLFFYTVSKIVPICPIFRHFLTLDKGAKMWYIVMLPALSVAISRRGNIASNNAHRKGGSMKFISFEKGQTVQIRTSLDSMSLWIFHDLLGGETGPWEVVNVESSQCDCVGEEHQPGCNAGKPWWHPQFITVVMSEKSDNKIQRINGAFLEVI